jgi:hypothetical protein
MSKYVILFRSRTDGRTHGVLQPTGRTDEIGQLILSLVEFPSIEEAEKMIAAIDHMNDHLDDNEEPEEVEDFQIVELKI